MAKKSTKKDTQTETTETTETSDASTTRNEVLHFVETALTHVESRLAALADGDKVSMQTLCAEISTDTGIPPERSYHIVSMYVNKRAGVTVARGRDGGIYKGVRPSKPIDPKQAERLQKRAAKTEEKSKALAAEAERLRQRAGNVTVAATEQA